MSAMSKINKQSVIWALEELSNLEEQKRLWLSDGSSGEVSSFVEAISGVFDDGGVSKALDSNELPQELENRFRELSKHIDMVPQSAPPLEQIEHPAMLEIVRISRELIELIAKVQ
jgi:hypothetical protein